VSARSTSRLGVSTDGANWPVDVRDESVVDRLHKVARHDCEHSHSLDLSDEGRLADLADRIEDSEQMLAIDANDEYAASHAR
jgi:hypothetical protein